MLATTHEETPGSAVSGGTGSLREVEKRRFAERLIAVMEQRGLSIAETARRVRQHLHDGEGFTDTNLVHYRQGRSMPRPRYLEALSRALDVEPTELTTFDQTAGTAPGVRVRRPRRRRSRQALSAAAPEDRQAVPSPTAAMLGHGSVVIEDFGDEVHLKIDQRLPWTVALHILQVIKGSRGE
jgi:transcriptional regulator with XRE-family HTH domain